MKYTNEITKKMVLDYENGVSVTDLADQLGTTERSIRAKLASLGLYKKKEYTNKLGQAPVKKEEYVDRIAKILQVNVELLDSLEKANKNVLKLIEAALKIE
jgi:transcriptional antiterminator